MINEDHFSYLEKILPEMSTSKQLVDLGLFGSEPSLCKARMRGDSPDYVQYSKGRILYPKSCVIKFLKDRLRSGSKPKEVL